MLVNILKESHFEELENFCNKCQLLGYNNNSSLDSMKYKWCKDWGEYWGAWHNNELIAVAGAHPLPEISDNSIRVLFRGCQINSPYSGLNASHMNSVPFRDILPVQIKHFKNKDLYITTNIDHDASGKMSRTHKVMKLLSKKDIVNLHVPEVELYYTKQSVWKLNKEKYFEIRHRLETP